MKRIIFSLITLFNIIQNVNGIDASIAIASFKTYTNNYVEIYAQIAASTVKYKSIDSSHYSASIEVTYVIRFNDSIVAFDKFSLNTHPKDFAIDLLDTKRFPLNQGKYILEATFRDLNKIGNERTYRKNFEINFDENAFQFSDIQLLNSFQKDTTESVNSKLGFFLENNPTAFYHRNMTKLGLFFEMYNSDKSIADDYYITYGIDRQESNGNVTNLYSISKKRSPRPIDAYIHLFDIKNLATGNYKVFVEARNREKKLIQRKDIDFQRSNPFMFIKDTSSLEDATGTFLAELTKDSLRYCLKAIQARTRGDENSILNQVIASDDPRVQRNFLYRYWLNQNPTNPIEAYNKYMEVANAVNKQFKSGFGYGFESDRGYIFMKYGKPNDVVSVDDDPSAPPYEIWVYYDFPVTKQSNVKFLFYNPSLAGNDYRILHSNARGELNNPRWQITLYKNAPNEVDGDNYNDATTMKDNFNRRASRYLEDL